MTDVDPRIALAQEQAAKINQRYGQKTAFVGTNPYATKSIPSPSLLFDYMSGLGGFPDNAPIEVFGAPSIGKTTIMGYGAIRAAQAMGKLTGCICLEPTYEDDWVIKNGINPEYNVVAYPDNLDEAFEIYHDWIYGNVIDYILFDSLVGSTSEADQEEGAKARPGGQAKTITWNLQRTVMRQAKNGIGSMFINQQRDDQKARIPGMVESPGGWALKHLAVMRIHLKPGKDRFMMKIDGQDKMVGREAGTAVFKKAKTHGALGKSAQVRLLRR
jgi:RecA/RadA recombinase